MQHYCLARVDIEVQAVENLLAVTGGRLFEVPCTRWVVKVGHFLYSCEGCKGSLVTGLHVEDMVLVRHWTVRWLVHCTAIHLNVLQLMSQSLTRVRGFDGPQRHIG